MPLSKEFIQLIKQEIEKRGWIELPARGTSMYPFIRQGDICRFESIEAANIKRGDILLFQTPHGSLVAHRFCRWVTSDRQQQYLCKGDTNLAHDEAIALDQMIGKMSWILRNGRTIYMKDAVAYVWGQMIISFPMISRLLRVYLDRRENKKA